jgi:hypothetical protein
MEPRSLTLPAAGLLVAASDSRGDAARQEMSKLQGTWQFVRWEVQGMAKSARASQAVHHRPPGRPVDRVEGRQPRRPGYLPSGSDQGAQDN